MRSKKNVIRKQLLFKPNYVNLTMTCFYQVTCYCEVPKKHKRHFSTKIPENTDCTLLFKAKRLNILRKCNKYIDIFKQRAVFCPKL